MKKYFLFIAYLLIHSITIAHPGVGIVMDSRGNVYYTDLHHVWKIAPDGTKSIAVSSVHTHEIYIDADDNIFVEHLWYEGEKTNKWGHRVWCLRPDGKLEEIIPATEGFLQNYSFVRDRKGNMYWTDRGTKTVIRKRNPYGTITIHAEADFKDVRWMMATAEGTIYLIDDGDLRRITFDGAVITIARDLKEYSITQFFVGSQHNLMGLWTDKEENVYVAGYGGRVVKKVSPDGHVSVVTRSSLPWSPSGGMIAPNGDMWLLEYSVTNAVRVRRISLNEKETIFG